LIDLEDDADLPLGPQSTHIDSLGGEDVEEVFLRMATLPVPWVDPVDISNAPLFLASDEARYITGQVLSVDAGMSIEQGDALGQLSFKLAMPPAKSR
jgi:NAD(P)-dependent dehydrogenase (short-subunit alcohol dehydrogenase family)